MALLILHTNEKNFKLHPNKEIYKRIKIFLLIYFKITVKLFYLILLNKNFASRLGLSLSVHPDRGKCFFST